MPLGLHPDLGGIQHFFGLQVGNGPVTVQPLPGPLHLTLAFDPPYNGVIENTLDLYRLTTSGWVTQDISTTLHLEAGYLVADVEWSGIYGLLGKTQRVYLPITARGQ
jgi:hypothetical protein